MANLLLFPVFAPAAHVAPADEAQRQAALDVTQSWIVEAPAGSGKTGLIMQRYLKLLADGSVDDPAQVLAITFTRKATFELRDRVLAQLRSAAGGEEPVKAFDAQTRPLAEAVLSRDRACGWDLLEQPRRLNIRTIDSVCAEIAGALPVLSRSGGGATPSEYPHALYSEAARRTTSMLGGGDAQLNVALEHVLLHRDGNLRDCESLITQMLEWREQWGNLVPLTPAGLSDAALDQEVLPKFERVLELAICSTLKRVTEALPADFLRQLCELASEMGYLDGYRERPSPLAFCAGNSTAPQAEAAHLAHWNALVHLLITGGGHYRSSRALSISNLGFMLDGTHRAILGALIDAIRANEPLRAALCEIRALQSARYPADQWRVTKALFRVLSHALIELQIVFAERNECDFAELGLLARAALRQEQAFDALRIASGQELQHLLVDEMQDTSSSQYELLELLTRGWGHSGQTLFLVGDPKQSIYLFRQARVERFVRTLEQRRLGEIELGVLRLTANFRSQSNLVHDFNRDFGRIFPSPGQSTATDLVAYAAADPVLPPSSALGRCWHTATIASDDDDALLRRQQRRRFAQEIRMIAEEWRSRRLEDPATLAVLVRNRNHLSEIVEAFKCASPSIPFRAVEVEALAERPEILDLVALTRALQHPADRTAWLALLRSPFCGLTLTDLHCLAGGDDDSLNDKTLLELIADRGKLLSPDGVARLQAFWPVMSQSLAQRGALTLSQRIDRTFRAFNGYRFVNEEQRANIAQYLNLLDELELAGGTVELSRLEARLGKLHASPSVHPGAIDLMTIHGAKGLEWDVVFVPALERVGKVSDTRLLTWLELDADTVGVEGEVAHGILAPIQSKGADSHALNQWMSRIERSREAAERKRLLYVACTRARQELHLFAAPRLSKTGGMKPAAHSLLNSAWPAVEDRFTDSAAKTLIVLPTAADSAILDQLAAAEAPPRTVQRIPLAHLSAEPLELVTPPHPHTDYDRPEGSFVARAFGNAVHAFLDRCAKVLASGTTADELLAILPEWSPRIAAVLRASGLAAQHVQRQTAGVLDCLQKTLSEPHGRWILAPHPGAGSESALVTWREQRASVRLDRSFLAGAQPMSAGSDHLWIVDFKTSTRQGADLQQFLAEHRKLHAPQMEFYAHRIAAQGEAVRVALYYPRLAAFDWWVPTPSAATAPS